MTMPGMGASISEARDAAQQDVDAQRKECLLLPPQWARSGILRTLADERDAPVAYLFLNITGLVVPAALLVFLAPPSHMVGAAYLAANYGLFITRFLVALLHVSEHRRLFRPEYGWLNSIAPHILAPLYGVPSGLYALHHRVMHHVEGNAASGDLSSTEPYQRDCGLHFLWYWLRHAVGAWGEVLVYALRRRRYLLLAQSLLAEGLYLGALRTMWLWRPVATLWVYLIPYAITSLALMLGNWSQHVFINPQCPGSAYGMAYNCVGCPDNAVTFNDGYHIEHHLNSRTHWSELPARYMDNIEQHTDSQALAFRSIGVFDVGLAVFMGRFEYLVDHLVSPGLAGKERSEVICMLKARLRPIKM